METHVDAREMAYKNLKDAEEALGIEKYNRAFTYLDLAKIYFGQAGVPVPEKVAELRKKANEIGAKESWKDVCRALDEGDNLRAFAEFGLMEGYYEGAGIPLPAEIAELGDKIAKAKPSGQWYVPAHLLR